MSKVASIVMFTFGLGAICCFVLILAENSATQRALKEQRILLLSKEIELSNTQQRLNDAKQRYSELLERSTMLARATKKFDKTLRYPICKISQTYPAHYIIVCIKRDGTLLAFNAIQVGHNNHKLKRRRY